MRAATSRSVRVSKRDGDKRMGQVRWGSSNSDLEHVAKFKKINTILNGQPRKIQKVRRVYVLHVMHRKNKANHLTLDNIKLVS